MKIELKKSNKKEHLDLLLLADEQESMIDKYLEKGDLFVLSDPNPRCQCVVTREDEETVELKNIATYKDYQRMGYASKLIAYISEYYKGKASTMLVGTGDLPSILGFYESCGFGISHRLENFFVDNYDHPIIDEGVQLIDMVYLKKELG